MTSLPKGVMEMTYIVKDICYNVVTQHEKMQYFKFLKIIIKLRNTNRNESYPPFFFLANHISRRVTRHDYTYSFPFSKVPQRNVSAYVPMPDQ